MNPVIASQLEHNHWATHEILQACEELSAADYQRDFAIGPRSLARTLAHIIDCIYYLSDGLQGLDYHERANFDGANFTPQELEAHLDSAARELSKAVAQCDLSSLVEFPKGSSRKVACHVIVAQAFDHGSHHRSQCAYMLKQLGRPIETHPLRWCGADSGD